MKKNNKIAFASLAFTTLFFTVACNKTTTGGGGGSGGKDETALSFSLSINDGSSMLQTGKSYDIDMIIETTGKITYDPNFKYTMEETYYTYTNDYGVEKEVTIDPYEYLNLTTSGTGLDKKGTISPIKSTKTSVVDEDDKKTYTFNEDLEIKVVGSYPTSEGFDKKVTRYLYVKVTDASPVDGGYNYSTAKYTAEDKSTEVLGLLEKYAMDNHLTGISLFENSGFIRYSDRIESPNGWKYITNYGFGVLSEGRIKDGQTLPGDQGLYKPTYYHSQSASNPDTINALDNQGSEVSGLYDYIASSYYAMKLNDDKTNAEWYPVLASNISRQKDGPIASDLNGNETGAATSTTWKIYVKCKENKTLNTPRDDKLTYDTLSSARSSFKGREVSIDDYIYAYKLLLTGSHNFFRGSELAADTTSGIVGAAAYYARTKTTGVDDKLFDEVVHLKKGHDEDGYFITIQTLNPMNQFTAMYTLSSNLYCPVPADFIEAIGGAKYYGKYNGSSYSPKDNILSLAPYTLETWEDLNIDFKRNANWQEFMSTDDAETLSHVKGTKNRYAIDGVAIRINKNAASDANEVYKQFLNGNVDAASIPTAYLETDKQYGHETQGSSVFKLNVNSCTQERWNELFGPNGTNSKHVSSESEIYNCKPWMSNDNFLNGLNLAIDRNQFATKRGATPSNAYFSDSYMSDAKNGMSYNKTQAHKNAIKDYYPDTYGYNLTAARASFKKAVAELVNDPDSGVRYGTASNPTRISIDIWWMYESDKTDYGTEIINYFQAAFNHESVCNNKIVLDVTQQAVTSWDKVYSDHLQCGKFDLGFGAISGNTYDPLNFLEVLKSDDSSGFTLNWGADTSKADPELEFDGKYWSFDALWTAADHGGIFSNGSIVTTAKGYIDEVAPYNKSEGNLIAGGEIKIEFIFADIVGIEEDKKRGVKFDITNVQLFPFGSANVTFEGAEIEINRNGNIGVVTVKISKAKAEEIEQLIRTGCKIKDTDEETYFQMMYYNTHWTMEFHYTMKIGEDGIESNGYFYVSRTEKDMEKDFRVVAK